MSCLIALVKGNARLRKLRTHRRVYIRVRARHPIAQLTCKQGEPAHERTANTQNVNVTRQTHYS